MCVKAIRIDALSKEIEFRILYFMFEDKLECKRVKYAALAEKLHVSEEVIRYNVNKLLKLGYIEAHGKYGFMPTDKVLFIHQTDIRRVAD